MFHRTVLEIRVQNIAGRIGAQSRRQQLSRLGDAGVVQCLDLAEQYRRRIVHLGLLSKR
jgi:hypothetical protein